jgi:hypothetical protein
VEGQPPSRVDVSTPCSVGDERPARALLRNDHGDPLLVGGPAPDVNKGAATAEHGQEKRNADATPEQVVRAITYQATAGARHPTPTPIAPANRSRP